MDKVCQILKQAEGLSTQELKRISEYFLNMLAKANGVHGLSSDDVHECRKCGSDKIVKFGRDAKGKQRYKCKSCGATFTEISCSVISGTWHSEEVWEKYISLLLIGASLKECAYQCEISIRTAFIWRHKILNALQKDQDKRMMAGIIEADEMFLAVSYKGNHKKSKRFIMPRKAFQRGSDNHSNKVPKACVMCAVERNGQSYGEVIGLGQPNEKMVTHAFENRVVSGSLVLSDYAAAIKNYFSKKTDVDLIRLQSTADGSRHSKIPEVRGIYHIQTVNNFHKRFHDFLLRYNGVATKYLNHYVNLFVWIENHKALEHALEESMKSYISEKETYIPARIILDLPALPAA